MFVAARENGVVRDSVSHEYQKCWRNGSGALAAQSHGLRGGCCDRSDTGACGTCKQAGSPMAVPGTLVVRSAQELRSANGLRARTGV